MFTKWVDDKNTQPLLAGLFFSEMVMSNRIKKNVTVSISNHCNMDTIANGCSYCCIQNRNTSPVLSFKKIESFILNDLKDEDVAFFEFFGGEPTVHFETIKEVVDKFKFKYRMYTNGLFDFDTWKDTLCRFDEVSFSIDGFGKFNSKRGIGNSTHVTNTCLNNINNSLSYGIPVTVAIVPSTEEHYDNLELIFSDFLSMGVRSFSLEIPSVIQDQFINKKFSKTHLNKIVEFFFGFVVEKFTDGDIDEMFLLNIPKEHYPGQANSAPCSETNIALSPRGNVYYCRDTSANEEKLFSTSKINFYSNLNEIKKIEKDHTCHVKFLQGYSHDSVVDSDNELEVRLMYRTIAIMNSYYRNYIDENYSKCEEELNLIRTFLVLYNSYMGKKLNAEGKIF